MMGLKAQLLYLIAWILRVPMDSLSDSTDLRSDLYLDQVDFDLMIFQLENYYDTEFSAEQIENIRTVRDIGNLLHP